MRKLKRHASSLALHRARRKAAIATLEALIEEYMYNMKLLQLDAEKYAFFGAFKERLHKVATLMNVKCPKI